MRPSSGSSLEAECRKVCEERACPQEHVQKLVLENQALAKTKNDTIQELQCSSSKLAHTQKALLQKKEPALQKQLALEKQSGLEGL